MQISSATLQKHGIPGTLSFSRCQSSRKPFSITRICQRYHPLLVRFVATRLNCKEHRVVSCQAVSVVVSSSCFQKAATCRQAYPPPHANQNGNIVRHVVLDDHFDWILTWHHESPSCRWSCLTPSSGHRPRILQSPLSCLRPFQLIVFLNKLGFWPSTTRQGVT